MPRDGFIEKTGAGHMVQLLFDSFSTRITCEIRSPKTAVLRVVLLEVKGTEPVIFNFFPALQTSVPASRQNTDLRVSNNGRTLQFRNITLQASEPVACERDFKITNPYTAKREIEIKPVRAFVTLKPGQPFVLACNVE